MAGIETILAEALAGVTHVDRVPVDGHFFDDLGANSLVMAHFCARVRKQAGVPPVSMRDIYRYPTIRQLASALSTAEPAPVEARQEEARQRTGAAQYVLCGALQLLAFLGYSYLVALIIAHGAAWVSVGSSPLELYVRLVGFGGAAFVALCALPVLVKWVLVGRWKPREIRVWSLDYYRFWLVKTLVQRSLVVLMFLGSPLYVLYLRALGAKIGPGVAIFSRNVPVCTDLLTIGAGSVIRKDSFFTGYRAHDGRIGTGRVTLGKNVFVGEGSVLDIETSLGDGAQLGHASSLHAGQAVPGGESWHGSPAQRADVDYRGVGPVRCGLLRRVVYGIVQLVTVVVVYLPLMTGGVDLLLVSVPRLSSLLDTPQTGISSWPFYRDALITSFLLLFGVALAGLVLVGLVPRVLNLAIRPGKVYPLYGFQYSVTRTIRFLTNLKFFRALFGDSSAIVHYLRYLGYDLSRVEQTGSNFGTQFQHETPFLSSVGSGTMAADGLSIINADYSSTSFRVVRVSIGAHNFLGNQVAYPAQGRTGDNCLLATKVLVPVDGRVRENTGLLGSPSFEIPRSVERDTRFDNLRQGDDFRRRLAAKNRHNTVSALLFLLARWFYLFGVILFSWITTDLYPAFGASAFAAFSVVVLLFSIVYFVLVERAAQVFHPLRPLYCSIYDRRFWWHERFWKAAASTAHIQILNGTPFKNLAWRMLGARLGSRVFDDGAFLPEKALVTIGDDVTLNAGAAIQCHSQEDAAFKLDRITIGSGCTVGVGAWVHYDVTMGDEAQLAPGSFLMKGEEVPPNARWAGNPARESRAVSVLNGNGRRGELR